MCPTGRNSPNFWRGELRHWCDKQYRGHPSGKDGRRQLEGVCHPVHQLLPRADCDRDIHFSGEITVDREKARCYTVCDGDYLPDRTVRSDVEDTTLPVSGCSLYMAELEGLGVHLHCNHAVNQILYFEGSEKLYEEFSRRVAVYRTNKGWDRAMLEPKADELENMQKEIMEERQLLCRANFSVMIWDDSPELLDRAEKKLREYPTVSDFKFYIPSYEHLANIYRFGSRTGERA